MKKYSAIFLAILIMGCNKSDTSKNNQITTFVPKTNTLLLKTKSKKKKKHVGNKLE